MIEWYLTLGAFGLGVGLYYWLGKRIKKGEQELAFSTRMHDVLTNDKYKTKGKFEE